MNYKWTVSKGANGLTGPGPQTFLPEGIDTSNLIDITRVSDPFRRFLDEKTGEIYDGSEYHRKFLESLGQE